MLFQNVIMQSIHANFGHIMFFLFLLINWQNDIIYVRYTCSILMIGEPLAGGIFAKCEAGDHAFSFVIFQRFAFWLIKLIFVSCEYMN